MLNKIGIENLRSLINTQDHDLRKINILVGKNSSGKSTFARILPLIRQSCETTTKGPILWWGKYVDFGNISNSLSRNSEIDSITFRFEIDVPLFSKKRRQLAAKPYYPTNPTKSLDKTTTAKIKLSIKKIDDYSTITKELSITVFNIECKLAFTDSSKLESLRIGKYQWKPSSPTIMASTANLKLLPIVKFYGRKKISDETYAIVQLDELRTPLRAFLATQVHGNTKINALDHMIDILDIGTDAEIFNQITKIQNAPRSWSTSNCLKGIHTEAFRALRDRIFASNLTELIEAADNALYRYFIGIKYVAPLRATAERYYRISDMAINEIDPQGENIAMYLNSLSLYEKDNLKSWMQETIGIHIRTQESQGHIAIEATDSNTIKPTNIVDLGFGFSQLLPVALHLWVATREANRLHAIQPTCVIIEQPELHLHPEMQAKLSNLFVKFIQTPSIKKANTTIIIETHSPHLINKLGELIYEGQVSRNDVQILLFEKNEHDFTTIRISEYGSNGVLQNWPIGFLDG